MASARCMASWRIDGISRPAREWAARRDRQNHFRAGTPGDLRLDAGGRMDLEPCVEMRIGIATRVRQYATARLPVSPVGAKGLPRKYSMVLSSTATRPARAPASMAILHRVMRPSTEQASKTSPPNSMAWPFPPAVPIRPITASTTSLAGHTSADMPLTRTSDVLRPASCTSAGLQARARLPWCRYRGRGAPKAPMGGGVRVAANHGHTRQGRALLGADHVDDALAFVVHGRIRPYRSQRRLASSAASCAARSFGSLMPEHRLRSTC